MLLEPWRLTLSKRISKVNSFCCNFLGPYLTSFFDIAFDCFLKSGGLPLGFQYGATKGDMLASNQKVQLETFKLQQHFGAENGSDQSALKKLDMRRHC